MWYQFYQYVQSIYKIDSCKESVKNYSDYFLINANICYNFKRLKGIIFITPIIVLSFIIIFLGLNHALNIKGYIEIQKDYFYGINNFLGQYPSLENNLTQLGDGLVCLALLSLLVLYAPKIWEAVVMSFLVSLVLTVVLKKNLKVPRPALIFDNQSFHIIGKKLNGINSCPSGHSITIFIVLSVLMFAFMPKVLKYKIMWVILILTIGLKFVLTRVGVGAHHPLDTVIGAILGYISALVGIFISRKYNIFQWMNNMKSYPLFILLFLIGILVLVNKIIHEQLIVFYIALICLIVSIYKIIIVYVKKKRKT